MEESKKIKLVDEILLLDKEVGTKELELKEAKTRLMIAESRLLEAMVNEQLAGFQDELGRKIALDPKNHASFKKEDRDKVFNWLREIGRDDAIKTDVNKKTLSSIVTKVLDGELEDATELPEFVSNFQQMKIKITHGSTRKSLRRKAQPEREESDEF